MNAVVNFFRVSAIAQGLKSHNRQAMSTTGYSANYRTLTQQQLSWVILG
ncbi:hypothetical protein LC613_10230 [Nostoc sphaeroides CHAB 2801]|nr:hypothetical protein [Nostoc sphaeroides]MCC5628463.1 hypothetical protein [Nostoc sphaeroides CHAB 2801]